MQPRKNACRPIDEHPQAEQLPVQRQRDRPQLQVAEAERKDDQQPEDGERDPRSKHEELRAVDEHRPQVDPGGLEGREPALALVVALAALGVLEEADRHLGGLKLHVHRLQHHLRRVLPGLRLQVHALQRVAADPPHSAVDV